MLNSGTKPDVTRHCSMWVKTYFNHGQLRTAWSLSLRHSVFSDLGYSYPKEKSALRGFLELVIGSVWGIWIWWITLLPQIAFDHRPGGYACHLTSENWVSCRCCGTLAASLCDRLMAVIVCFYILRTIMKGKEPNILCQLACILAMHFTCVSFVYFVFFNLGGGLKYLKYFPFLPLLGEIIQFD